MDLSLTSRRRVGSTALFLPPLGFGAAHLGGMYHRVTEADSVATLQAAWDGGIRYYDVAPYYGRGLSEHRLGGFLLNQPRDQLLLTTKVGRYFKRPADPRTFDRAPWGGGLNIRLGLDTIDALLIHDPEASLAPDGSGPRIDDMADSGIKALEELKRSGQIKAIGMGLNAASSLQTFATRVPLDFVIVAMAYTLLDQDALDTGLAQCVDEKVSVIIGAPFASGILATGPGPEARYRYGIAPPEIQGKVHRIVEVCNAHHVTLQAAALQFPLSHPAVVSVIPGGVRPQEVRQNISALMEPLPPTLWSDLKGEGLIRSDTPI